MPAQIAHILLGIEALGALDPAVASRLDGPAFRLGCQGPDIFYHNRRTKPGAFLYGTRLHRRGWGSFLDRFRREALDRGWGPDHPGTAFLLGQATHGFLDRQAHPFIVYHSGWKIPGVPSTDVLRHAHAFLERILDVLLWERHSGGPVSGCQWQDDVPPPGAFPPDFWHAWAEALHGVFPRLSARDEVEARLRNAVTDTRGFLSYTSPASGDRVRAVRTGALPWFHPRDLPPWDFLNLEGRVWRDPVSGAAHTESIPELFARTAAEAQATLAVWNDPGKPWEDRIGNGSLNLPGAEGENQAPVHCRPWDYGALFDREVRFRLGGAG